jgi:hypothetical protein
MYETNPVAISRYPTVCFPYNGESKRSTGGKETKQNVGEMCVEAGIGCVANTY